MAIPTLIATPGAVNANSYGTRAEADTYFDTVIHADAPWSASVAASATLGSGTNGVLTVSADDVGTPGNAFTIAAVLGSGNNIPLSAALVGSAITITLGTDGSGLADSTKNTAVLVAGVVAALTGVTADYSGTGSTRIPVTTIKSFTGGSYGDETKIPALLMAAQQLDALVNWTGYVTSVDQKMAWPRTGMVRRHGLSFVPTTEIPDELKAAQFELARLLVNSDRTTESEISASGITHLRAGPITVKFRDYGELETSVLTSAVWNLLVPSWYSEITGLSDGTFDLVRA